MLWWSSRTRSVVWGPQWLVFLNIFVIPWPILQSTFQWFFPPLLLSHRAGLLKEMSSRGDNVPMPLERPFIALFPQLRRRASQHCTKHSDDLFAFFFWAQRLYRAAGEDARHQYTTTLGLPEFTRAKTNAANLSDVSPSSYWSSSILHSHACVGHLAASFPASIEAFKMCVLDAHVKSTYLFTNVLHAYVCSETTTGCVLMRFSLQNRKLLWDRNWSWNTVLQMKGIAFVHWFAELAFFQRCTYVPTLGKIPGVLA